MLFAGLLVIVCLIQGVPAPDHIHTTKICKHCDQAVKHPADCQTRRHCRESCVTDMFLKDGEYYFTYGCHHNDKCNHVEHHAHHAELGQHVCRECCQSTGCDSNTCVHLTAAPVPTTTISTVTLLPTTTSTTTLRNDLSTTTKPSGMIKITQAQTTSGTSTGTIAKSCADSADDALSCADMKNFGYCDPVSGAGYALAQIRCPLTCGLCH